MTMPPRGPTVSLGYTDVRSSPGVASRRRERYMSHRRIVVGILTVLLSLVVTGCAGRATHTGAAPAGSAASSSDARLSGTWHGTFYELFTVGEGGAVGTISLVINNDQTFTETLTGLDAVTLFGVVITKGDSVVLQNSSGDSVALTLNRKDCTIHGATRFLIAGRVVAVQLKKAEPTGDRETASVAPAPSRGRRC
jgi:hypothetical protein